MPFTPSNCLPDCLDFPHAYKHTHVHTTETRFLTGCCVFSWRRETFGLMRSSKHSWRSWRWRYLRREGSGQSETLTGEMRWVQKFTEQKTASSKQGQQGSNSNLKPSLLSKFSLTTGMFDNMPFDIWKEECSKIKETRFFSPNETI